MTPMPAVLSGRTQWQWSAFSWNSCYDQGLSVSYSLASKSGVMCNPVYMTTVFWDTSHYQLLLFVEGASSKLVHHVCFVWPSNCEWMMTIGPRTAENGCSISHGVPKWMVHPTYHYDFHEWFVGMISKCTRAVWHDITPRTSCRASSSASYSGSGITCKLILQLLALPHYTV